MNVDRAVGREIRILDAELLALKVAISHVAQSAHLARTSATASTSSRRSSQPVTDLSKQPRCLEDAGGPVWWLEPVGLCATFRAITARAVTTAR